MQVGTPMDLYKNPDNLYVAKFIGTPSINTFNVQVKDKKVVGLEQLIDGDLNVADGEYIIGLRPENFEIDEAGMALEVDSVKLLGRDIQISTNMLNEVTEVIIRNIVDTNINDIKLKVKAQFIYVFEKDTEKRIKDATEK